MLPKCCWILANGKLCGAKVSFKIVKDDDNNPQRKYSTLCTFHKAKDHAQQILNPDNEEF